MQLTLTTNIDIPEEALIGVLTTALCGGIGYWGEALDYEQRDDFMITSAVVREHDPDEQNLSFQIDAEAVLLGVKRLHAAIGTGDRDVHPNSEIGAQFLHHLFADQVEDGLDMVDAVAADAIIQMACFGEIRYG